MPPDRARWWREERPCLEDLERGVGQQLGCRVHVDQPPSGCGAAEAAGGAGGAGDEPDAGRGVTSVRRGAVMNRMAPARVMTAATSSPAAIPIWSASEPPASGATIAARFASDV